MIERIIRAIKTIGLKTRVEFLNLEKGEILRAKFKNERDFKGLLNLRAFVEAGEEDLIMWRGRKIPIIPAAVVEVAAEIDKVDEMLIGDISPAQEMEAMPTPRLQDLQMPTRVVVEEVVEETVVEEAAAEVVEQVAEQAEEPVTTDAMLVEDKEEEKEVESPILDVTPGKTLVNTGMRSRCPICNRVKSKTAEFCKQCTAGKTRR